MLQIFISSALIFCFTIFLKRKYWVQLNTQDSHHFMYSYLYWFSSTDMQANKENRAALIINNFANVVAAACCVIALASAVIFLLSSII